MTKKNEVVAQEINPLSMMSDECPDFLKNQVSDRGSENVTVADLVVPRLDQCQSLSPCRKKDDAAYIPGIQDGDLFNNVTRKNYGTEVLIIPVFYRKEWIIWKDRDFGGGFRGAFPTEAVAKEALVGLEDADQCEIQDCAQHFSLLVHLETGEVEDLVLSMSRSKMKASRTLNSLVRLNGGDSFSRIYRVKSISDKNSKNQDYYNISISPAGFPSKAIYDRAEKMYNSIVAGEVAIDRSFDNNAEGSINQESEY